MKNNLRYAAYLILCVVFCLAVIALVIALVALFHNGIILDGTNPRFDGGQ